MRITRSGAPAAACVPSARATTRQSGRSRFRSNATPAAVTTPITHNTPAATRPTRRARARRQSAGDEQRCRHPDREHIARDQIVDSAGDQQQVQHQAGERDPAGDQRAAARGAFGPEPHERRGQDQHGNRERLQDRMRRPVEPARELRHDLAEPAPERRQRDPARVAGSALADRERDQREPAQPDDADRDLHRSPRPVRPQQQDGLGDHSEDRVVVGGQSERGRDHPAREQPRRRRRSRVREREERHAREQHEHLVGARLLRVPDQQRAARGQRRGDHSRPPGDQLRPRAVRHRHHQHAAHRRERAQAGLAVAEHARPQPRHAVVERWSRLGLRDQPEHLARREMHEQRGVALVEPEALVAEPVEAQDGREHGDRSDREHRRLPQQSARPRRLCARIRAANIDWRRADAHARDVRVSCGCGSVR